MHPRSSYIVCTTARSGSNLLCETLQSTGVLDNPDVEYFYGPAEIVWSKRWKIRKYQDYVRRVIRMGTTPNGIFGVKIMYGYFPEFVGKLATSGGMRPVSGHLNFPETTAPHFSLRHPLRRRDRTVPLSIHQILESTFPHLHYIFVTREDKVRQAVSHSKALQTGQWTSRDVSPEGMRPEFDFDQIDGLLKTTAADEVGWRAYFDEIEVQPLTINYEQLMADPRAVVRRVFEHLKMAAPQDLILPEPALRKQADTLTEEWVTHYHNLRTRVGDQQDPQ